MSTAESIQAELEARGYRKVDSVPKRPALKPGARVRNYGEQFSPAFTDGTATVVAVMRQGTDEVPDWWERSWGRPNVEVIVERDDAQVGFGAPKFTNWADYGTVLALGSDS